MAPATVETLALSIEEADLLAEFLEAAPPPAPAPPISAARSAPARPVPPPAPATAPALLEALLDPAESVGPFCAAASAVAAAPSGTAATEDAGQPMQRFVDAVITVARSYLDARAAEVAGILLLEDAPPRGLDVGTEAALARASVLETTSDGPCLAPSFVSTRRAWGALLRGESADFSGCGETTLDQWAAGLIAALAGRSDVTTIQRALRKQKVAAFGMLD